MNDGPDENPLVTLMDRKIAPDADMQAVCDALGCPDGDSLHDLLVAAEALREEVEQLRAGLPVSGVTVERGPCTLRVILKSGREIFLPVEHWSYEEEVGVGLDAHGLRGHGRARLPLHLHGGRSGHRGAVVRVEGYDSGFRLSTRRRCYDYWKPNGYVPLALRQHRHWWGHLRVVRL